ncbi:hypothetical protein GALMADRAFT_217498 [Galerina marginata CBS 339.88]|uniref:Uncharacterized protein n=1 Tax=Galerina marginata (strain CBS 339.88) TaxID=685588 RepID=A0A067S6R4_GALM3|nr:hypothetical protein GALMADRAFT_217498 [Galerina marginata CBS 339.88]
MPDATVTPETHAVRSKFLHYLIPGLLSLSRLSRRAIQDDANDVVNCSHPLNLVENPVATKTLALMHFRIQESAKDVVNPTYLHSVFERPWRVYRWRTKHCYLCRKEFKDPARCLRNIFSEHLRKRIWKARDITGVCKIPKDLTPQDMEIMRATLKNPERTFAYQCPRCYKPCTMTPFAERSPAHAQPMNQTRLTKRIIMTRDIIGEWEVFGPRCSLLFAFEGLGKQHSVEIDETLSLHSNDTTQAAAPCKKCRADPSKWQHCTVRNDIGIPYRCQPCVTKRCNCPWKEDFVVEFTMKELDYDQVKAKEMYKKHGSRLRACDSNGRRKGRVGAGDEDGDGDGAGDEDEDGDGAGDEDGEPNDGDADDEPLQIDVSTKDPRSRRQEGRKSSTPPSKAPKSRKRRFEEDNTPGTSPRSRIKPPEVSKSPEASSSSSPPAPKKQKGTRPDLNAKHNATDTTATLKLKNKVIDSQGGHNRLATTTATSTASVEKLTSLTNSATAPPTPTAPTVALLSHEANAMQVDHESNLPTTILNSEPGACPPSLPFSELRALQRHNDGISQQLAHAEKKYRAALNAMQDAIAEKATSMIAVARLEAELKIIKHRDDRGTLMVVPGVLASTGNGLAREQDGIPSGEQIENRLDQKSLEARKTALEQEMKMKITELQEDCEKQSKDTWAVLDKISRSLARARKTPGDGNEERLRKLQAFVDEQAIEYHRKSKDYMYSEPKSSAEGPPVLTDLSTPALASASHHKDPAIDYVPAAANGT